MHLIIPPLQIVYVIYIYALANHSQLILFTQQKLLFDCLEETMFRVLFKWKMLLDFLGSITHKVGICTE